jgi:hypothetical protein
MGEEFGLRCDNQYVVGSEDFSFGTDGPKYRTDADQPLWGGGG